MASRESYEVRDVNTNARGQTQIEFDVHYDKLKVVQDVEEQNSIAPLRIFSFDIECYNQLGKGFPTAEKNPVIQIC